jgi:hypothetical protein
MLLFECSMSVYVKIEDKQQLRVDMVLWLYR